MASPTRLDMPTASPTPALLADLQRTASVCAGRAIPDREMAELCRASVKAWRNWCGRADGRKMPLSAIELLCIALAVGTIEHGPYIPPGDWMRPWVRDALCLWFRK